MFLTSNGEFALTNLNDTTKTIYFNLKTLLPHKLHNNHFNSFSYQKAEPEGNDPQTSRVFFYNQNGLLIEFSLDHMLAKITTIYKVPDKCLNIHYMKDTH
jgi:hypothetical protein